MKYVRSLNSVPLKEQRNSYAEYQYVQNIHHHTLTYAHAYDRDREYEEDYFAVPLSSTLEIGIISDYR
jgi:hypothetical protein